ncbi:MAG: valine--tRNA ligase, partial [Anaerolineae bacterium]
ESALDEESEARMAALMDLVRGIRNVRAEYNVQAGRRIDATVAAGALRPVLEGRSELLVSLARLNAETLEIAGTAEAPPQSASVVAGEMVAYLPLAGMVDLEAERERLRKNLEELEGHIESSRKRLAGPFSEKAPEHIVEQARERLAEMEAEADQIREQLARLS